MITVRNFLVGVGVATLLLACTFTTQASTFTINTGLANDEIGRFGYPNSATYGQTITAVPVTTQLDSFTFYIRPVEGAITYRAFVMQWDGSKATGPVLFMSSDQLAATSGLNPYTYNTGGINLTPGQQYVLGITTSMNYVPTNSTGVVGCRCWDNAYGPGTFVWMNNGDNFGQLTTDDWIPFVAFDMAFSAQFSSPAGATPTPEPAAMILLGTGCAAVAAQMRKRRAKKSL